VKLRISASVGPQLALPTVFEQEELARDTELTRYAIAHRNLYVTFARTITPYLESWPQVWDRLAFAILTANANTDHAVVALHLAQRARGSIGFHSIPGMTPDKARYVNKLPTGRAIFHWRKRKHEGWHRYRLRLMEIDGLAMTKASYAACLLYPLEAEVACLDTWMQKLLTGVTGFDWLTADEYLEQERRLARWARTIEINLALAQWIAWDWLRGTGPNPQRYFDDQS
jgi:hypothetical protein